MMNYSAFTEIISHQLIKAKFICVEVCLMVAIEKLMHGQFEIAYSTTTQIYPTCMVLLE
jgi:hypothetical protein